MAVMSQAIQQSCCHLFITKDIGPFSKAEVGRDNDTGSFIQLADQMKQQRSTYLTEGQIAQLIQYHQLRFLLQLIDQFNGG